MKRSFDSHTNLSISIQLARIDPNEIELAKILEYQSMYQEQNGHFETFNGRKSAD
jgi:hypothetical protein